MELRHTVCVKCLLIIKSIIQTNDSIKQIKSNSVIGVFPYSHLSA